MAEVTGSIFIERPVDVVFDFVADERNEPLYNRELLQSEMVTEGPIAAGTRFRALHTRGRRTVDMAVEVTGYDRPRRVASRTTMSWADVDGEITFEPVGAATLMRWTWDVHPKGFARLLTPLVGLIGRRSERACWEGLKGCLEARGTP